MRISAKRQKLYFFKKEPTGNYRAENDNSEKPTCTRAIQQQIYFNELEKGTMEVMEFEEQKEK